MRVRIHRGAAEVGGNCVEVEAEGSRLVIDLGRPLSAGLDDAVELPEIDGLRGQDPTLLGVLLSHAHLDHYGLVAELPPTVPVFVGAVAGTILEEAALFSPAGLSRDWAGVFTDGAELGLGPFTVTPLLVDHSAVDAYAFVVEADGRRLLYSGDLRAHGSDPEVFERLLERLAKPIHALLLEGTRVGRAELEGDIRSERDLERELVAIFDDAPGLVLVSYSAQNIDRLRTLYWATLNSKRRLLLIDPYVDAMAGATGRDDVPRAGLPGAGLYVPQTQRIKIKELAEFERVDGHRAHRVFPEDLRERREELVLTFRPSMATELERAGCLEGARLLWSMWPGYLREDRMAWFRNFLRRHRIEVTVAHASGHATPAGLKRLAEATDAECVVPIHTDAPERYPELFRNVTPHADGEWWEV